MDDDSWKKLLEGEGYNLVMYINMMAVNNAHLMGYKDKSFWWEKTQKDIIERDC